VPDRLAGGRAAAADQQDAGRKSRKRPHESEDNCLYAVEVRFEWGPRKAAANLRTRRVGFAEAVMVLEDDFALTREDRDAVDEERFMTLGLVNLGNLPVVVYAYRDADIIRSISGWNANKRQRLVYERGRSSEVPRHRLFASAAWRRGKG